MSDPLRKVQAGEPFKPSANTWNAFVDAARAEQQRQLDRQAAQPSTFRDPDIIRVRNETGRDLRRFAVVGISSPLFVPGVAEVTNAFAREVTFRGVVPTANSAPAILLEPALQGRVVKAQLSGVIHVRLNVTSDTHTFAGCATGVTDRVESKGSGPLEILWKETDESGYAYDTGEMWAIVRFGTRRETNAAFVAAEDIPAATSPVQPGFGPAVRWFRNRTTNIYEPSDLGIVVFNWAPSPFPANRLGIASDVDGDWVATYLPCGAQSTEPYD